MRRRNGITLIALVITIIVMLILIGITVTVAMNSGLFNVSKKATEKTQIEKNKELLFTTAIGSLDNDRKVNYEILDNEAQQLGFNLTEYNGTYTKDGKTYIVDESGNVVVSETIRDQFLKNGQISSANPGKYMTANFDKEISPNSLIMYYVTVDDTTYGPYTFGYIEEGKNIVLNAHNQITCKMYNNRITAVGYSGSWYDIYVDMYVVMDFTKTKLMNNQFLDKGQISSANPGQYMTANFDKEISPNSIILYYVTSGNAMYGPYLLTYLQEEQRIYLNGRGVSCTMYNDKITATYYGGSWSDIYVDMFVIDNMNELYVRQDQFLKNGKISNANPGKYMTADFDKPIALNSTIIYYVTVNNIIYGPRNFKYTQNGQNINLIGHTNITCTINNDKITAKQYGGNWYDIYVDMFVEYNDLTNN